MTKQAAAKLLKAAALALGEEVLGNHHAANAAAARVAEMARAAGVPTDWLFDVLVHQDRRWLMAECAKALRIGN